MDKSIVFPTAYWNTCLAIDKTIDVVEALVCKRCSRHTYTGFHHPGKWMWLVKPRKPISVNIFKQWVDDEEHGLFHGLSTLIAASLAVPAIINCQSIADLCDRGMSATERMIIGSLLHDFGRFINPDNHDGVMKEYFPFLPEVVFTHSNPEKISHPIIVGDRLELNRFDDFDTWKRNDVDISSTILIEHYYQMIRPALQYLFINRNSECLRHGIEEDSVYPFEHGRFPIAKLSFPRDEAACPIDTGTPMYHLFVEHGCIWGKRYGVISIEDAKKAGIKFFNRNTDHLYMLGDAPLSQWTFVHNATMMHDNFTASAANAKQRMCPVDLIQRILRTLTVLQCLLKAMMCEI